MNAERLDNGHIRVPVRLESDGVIGDGVVDLAPGDPDYDEWDEFLGGGKKASKAIDLELWERKALHDFRAKGRVWRAFKSDSIDADEHARISAALKAAQDVPAIKAAFKRDAVDTLLDSVDGDARKWAEEAIE